MGQAHRRTSTGRQPWIARWLAWAARPVPLAWLLGLGALWCLLSAGDVLSTTLVQHCGARCGHENNPLAALLWHRGGIAALGLDKLLIGAALALGVWTLYRWLRTPRLALMTLLVVDALTALTVANNVYWLVAR